MMLRGDLVHVPQGTILLADRDEIYRIDDEVSYLKLEKPSRAIFWCLDMKSPAWASVYYRNRMWNIRTKNIYPIIQEIENAN